MQGNLLLLLVQHSAGQRPLLQPKSTDVASGPLVGRSCAAMLLGSGVCADDGDGLRLVINLLLLLWSLSQS